MNTNAAVNIPEKTAADGRRIIKEFNELIALRSPHKLSEQESSVIESFQTLIEFMPEDQELTGEAQELFWRIKDFRENWYSKKIIN